MTHQPDDGRCVRRSATPEQALIFAIVRTAIEDLNSDDEQVRFEAFEFMLQPTGPLAESRRTYFSILGLDEDAVQYALRDRLNDPPERPDKKWTASEVFNVLPKGRFNAKMLTGSVNLRYGPLASRLQYLEREGLITKIDRGVFVRTDNLVEYEQMQADFAHKLLTVPDEPEPEKVTPDTILSVLHSGAKTIRQIEHTFDGAAGSTTIRGRLYALHESGKVIRDGPMWRLKRDHGELLDTMCDGPKTAEEISDELELDANATRCRINRAHARGLIKRVGNRWTLKHQVIAA